MFNFCHWAWWWKFCNGKNFQTTELFTNFTFLMGSGLMRALRTGRVGIGSKNWKVTFLSMLWFKRKMLLSAFWKERKKEHCSNEWNMYTKCLSPKVMHTSYLKCQIGMMVHFLLTASKLFLIILPATYMYKVWIPIKNVHTTHHTHTHTHTHTQCWQYSANQLKFRNHLNTHIPTHIHIHLA